MPKRTISFVERIRTDPVQTLTYPVMWVMIAALAFSALIFAAAKDAALQKAVLEVYKWLLTVFFVGGVGGAAGGLTASRRSREELNLILEGINTLIENHKSD